MDIYVSDAANRHIPSTGVGHVYPTCSYFDLNGDKQISRKATKADAVTSLCGRCANDLRREWLSR